MGKWLVALLRATKKLCLKMCLGAKVKAYDPILSPAHKCHHPTNAVIESDALSLAKGCDALVLVTEWKEFTVLDYRYLSQRMNTPILIDGRNILNAKALQQAGFEYMGIGR